jgi:hypothetical protein|nr:MAG TPA: PilA, PilC, PilN, PilO, PilM, pilus, ring, membrane channel [Caudoviricetes sp.]
MNKFNLDKLNKILLILVVLTVVFTFGLWLGIFTASNNLEQLARSNIVKERKIQEQKERIRELQEFKQLKEIYG